LTANSTTLSDGTYIASASNSGGGTSPFSAFTNILTTPDYWGELGSSYWNTSGVYLLSVTTTVSSVSYSGEWLQIQMPNPITLYSYTITGRQDQFLYAYRTPFTFVIAGSNNGSTWTLVDYVDGTKYASQNDGNCNNFICAAGNTNSYTYFRMIITRISNNSNASSGPGGAVLNVAEWALFANNVSVTNKQTKIPSVAMNSNNSITFQPVSAFNWYTLMTYGITAGSYTPTLTGSDPFKQLQLTNGGQGVETYCNIGGERVQNFPFTFTFQLYCVNNSSGDYVNLAFGGGGSSNTVTLNFQIFSYLGIRLYDSSGTLRVSSATNWYNSVWNEIRVVYNATATNTWTIFFNGTQIIQYSDPNFWNLIMNGGDIWGFYTKNGMSTFTSYIRNVNMDLNLSNSIPGTIQSNNVSLAGNYTITASNTRTDRAAFPYYIADNAGIGSDWGFSTYNVSTGAYTGAVSTTVSGVTVSGEWLQYQLPSPVIVSSFTLLPNWGNGSNNYMPRSFCLAASNDGSTWVNVFDNTSVTWVYSVEQNFTVNNNGNKYSYYRLIVRLTGLSSGNFNSDWVSISRFDLFTPSVSSLSNSVSSATVPPTGTNIYGNTFTAVANPNNLLNGTYTASASTNFGSHDPWTAFEGYRGTGVWATSTASYSSGTNLYSGGVSTTVDNIAYLGEWLQIQVPNAISVVHVKFHSRKFSLKCWIFWCWFVHF
jgi:hypothetical protein